MIQLKTPELICMIFVSVMISSASGGAFFSQAKLHPNCLKVKPTSTLSANWGLQLFAGARFYIPFGNTKALYHVSELISGTKVESNEGLKKMCALVRIKGFKLSMEGHGDHFMAQDCSVIKKGENYCEANPNSENQEAQKHGDGIFTIVWTDNEESMAFVRCTADGLYNDWYVFSTSPTFNDTMKSTVLSTMNKLGFQNTLNDTVSLSYDGCTLFPKEEED